MVPLDSSLAFRWTTQEGLQNQYVLSVSAKQWHALANETVSIWHLEDLLCLAQTCSNINHQWTKALLHVASFRVSHLGGIPLTNGYATTCCMPWRARDNPLGIATSTVKSVKRRIANPSLQLISSTTWLRATDTDSAGTITHYWSAPEGQLNALGVNGPFKKNLLSTWDDSLFFLANGVGKRNWKHWPAPSRRPN